MKFLVDIYRSEKKEGLYVYLAKGDKLEDLPETLIKHCGKLSFAMSLLLTPEKKLARADTLLVIEKVRSDGFYVQMPPAIDDIYMKSIPNDKMQRS